MREIVATALFIFFAVARLEAQIDPSILRPVGYHPSDVTYFNTPYLSNSMAMGGEWYEFTDFFFCGQGEEGCKAVDITAPANAAQFVNGYPQSLSPRGPNLRALLFGLNINNTDIRPPGWPAHDNLAKGKYVLTWQGNADIRLKSGTFQAGESSGAATGNLLNGRRVYICNTIPESLEIRGMASPITDIKVWMPAVDDPATPAVNEAFTDSLEGEFFHPLFLQRIADASWSFIRFMDWGKTNASPQQDWVDRRVPNHVFQAGVINSRQPSATAEGHRETGVAWEHMVALSNATDRDLWINVPHLATADYITRLAQLIRFGSDGVNPYTSPNANPVFAPLESNLKVYVEFSNEIWSAGFSFPQGNWAEEQAALIGLTGTSGKAQFTARKFCDTWRIFQSVFTGETSRLVRVAAIFTALDAYSRPFLTEIGTYGQTLTPPVRPDVLALTTYFGNDIQGFVNAQAFTAGKQFGDSYWQSDLFKTHMHLAFEEWKRRILAGDSVSGSGPDATGTSGGFDASLRDLAKETLPYCSQLANAPPCLPLIAYEGGPSIFTNTIDLGDTITDDGVTTFMEAMNRDPRIADVYRIHLDLAKSKGLWTHTPYTDTSQWSRFGQWGHLELLEQDPADSPKYSLMLEHFTLFSTLRHIDAALGGVPSFVTTSTLPSGIAGQSYTTTITTTGGTGSRSVVVVGALLDAGLAISNPSADTLQISGTPITSRKNYILARVQDADGDPAWRTFTLETFGGLGTLIQSNFFGTSPALNRPFTQTFVLNSAEVSWGGWNIGAGVTARPGNDAFVFGVTGPTGDGTNAQDSTLAQAITDNEFLTATITPASPPLNLGGAEVRFATRRIGFHSPRGYALYSSIDGFANPLYTSALVDKDNTDENEHVVILPAEGFTSINSAVTFRIYAFGAQFSGHDTSLAGFKLTEKIAITVSSLSPSSGPTAGGQSVIISGSDLAGATSVTFGGTAGTITANTSTAINVTSPPASAGTVNVVVTTPTGNRTLTGAYRYIAAPTISTILPSSGSTSGGQSVVITGTNLSNATSVTIAGLPAPILANTATSLTVTTPAHAAGAVNVVVKTAGGTATSTDGYTYVITTLAAPTNLIAEAVSAAQVNLTWNAVSGATGYQVDRKQAGGVFTLIGTPSSPSFPDPGRTANTSYLYQVRATGASGTSANSTADLATTILFTDTLNSFTPIRSIHVTELRTAVNAVRALAGHGVFAFNGTAAAGTIISAIHLTELRSALDAARATLGFAPVGYTDPSPAGVRVKAVHWQELRSRVE